MSNKDGNRPPAFGRKAHFSLKKSASPRYIMSVGYPSQPPMMWSNLPDIG